MTSSLEDRDAAPEQFSPKTIQLLKLLHAPTSYESGGERNDISFLCALHDVDTSILSPELRAAVQNFLQREDWGEMIKAASSLADSNRVIGELQSEPEVRTIKEGLASVQERQVLEKFLMVEWLEQMLVGLTELQQAIDDLGDILCYEEGPELNEKLQRVMDASDKIGISFWLIHAIPNTDFIKELLGFIAHDFFQKAMTHMKGAAFQIMRCELSERTKPVYERSAKAQVIARNSLQTQLALLGARNEVRSPQLHDIQETAESLACSYGYKVQILTDPTLITDLEEGVIGIYVDSVALNMIQVDIAFFQNMVLQIMKNALKLQYLKSYIKARDVGWNDWKGKGDPRVDRQAFLISLDSSEDLSRVNLRICDQAIGLGYDEILEELREEARTCREPEELNLIEKLLLDQDGIDQIPPIALNNQLIARGRTRTAGGTGLGLAATSLFANLNGGFLSMGNSNLVKGAVASVTFPIPQQDQMTPDGERNARIESLNALADRILTVNELGQPVDPAIAEVLHPEALVYDEDQEALLAVYQSTQVDEIMDQVRQRLESREEEPPLAAYLRLLNGVSVEPDTPPFSGAPNELHV